jgi:hypothetical protein
VDLVPTTQCYEKASTEALNSGFGTFSANCKTKFTILTLWLCSITVKRTLGYGRDTRVTVSKHKHAGHSHPALKMWAEFPVEKLYDEQPLCIAS